MRHSTCLEVHLENIGKNVCKVRELAPSAKLIAMVKGNAYGHGITTVSQYLAKSCDVHHFGVASLGEALAICDEVPYIAEDASMEIFIFSDNEIMNEDCQAYYKRESGARLTPIIGTMSQLETFCTSPFFVTSKLCLKLNTGMNRLGLDMSDLEKAIPLLRQRGGVDLLLQHFSNAGSANLDSTKAQYASFQVAKRFLLDSNVAVRATSTSNSAAIERGIGVDETYVRPGLMLYGPRSVRAPRIWDGAPASYFYTRVLRHMTVTQGECVGYGLNPVSADGVLVLLPIGYADGFLRHYRGMPINVAPVNAGMCIVGKAHGFVNMDLLAVMVYPEEIGKTIEEVMTAVMDESTVMVWGGDINEKADTVGTISYELMCSLSIRVPRVYKGE